MYLYYVYLVMSKSLNQNNTKRSETGVVQIVFDGVLYHVSALLLLPFAVHD